ncbi:MAG: S1C family serine protease [Vicinamibacterales bacterium]
MSAKVRFWSLGAALAGGLVLAVSSLVAQDRGQPEAPERGARQEMFLLDGRGSRLGVTVRDLEAAEVTASVPGGAKIDDVDRDSPADKAGLRAGDVVVEYDGERVRSARQFTRLVQETPEGRQVTLAVLRDGSRQTLTATPEARGLSWNMDIDGERLRREVERGMRGLDGLRGWRMDPPAFDFRFDPEAWPMGHGRLGVTLQSLTDQLARYFGASDGGALVTSVREGSPAEKAGLEAGDVITSIDGEAVRDAGDVMSRIRRASADEVTIGYLRDRKAASVKATLEPRGERGRRTVRPAAGA